jgi:hypothetical protein
MSFSVQNGTAQVQQKSELMLADLSKVMNFLPQDILDNRFSLSHSLTDMVDDYKRALKVRVVEAFEEVDQHLHRLKERKRFWESTGISSRSVKTELGTITFHRHTYRNKLTGKYEVLVDRALGLLPHEQLSVRVQADTLEGIALDSYRRVGNRVMFEEELSPVAVEHLLHRLPDLEIVVPETNKRVRYLYIEADEDHVSRQALKEDERGREDKSYIHLVVIHEGVITVGQGNERRNRLVNKTVISGDYGANIETLWDKVTETVYKLYDVEHIEQIFVSGDGAAWIKRGAEEFAGSIYVMDAFHVDQHIKRASLGDGRAIHQLSRSVRTLTSFEDSKVKLYFDTRLSDPDVSERECQTLREEYKYFEKNWHSIMNRHHEGFIGTHMEGQVSHVLASRMSMKAMSWSIRGGHKEAKLRAFKANGGDVLEWLLAQRAEAERNREISELDLRVNAIPVSRKNYFTTYRVETPVTKTSYKMSRLIRGL